jgi:hypothetical protein
MTLHYYKSNALLVVNAKGLIRVLYTPFRVLCPIPFENLPGNTWIYVDEVCSNEKDELIYLIYRQPYSHTHFRLQISF